MNQKVCSWKGATALLCAALMLFVPIYLNAQTPAQPTEGNPCDDAESAAREHVSAMTWKVIGIGCGVFGWIIAAVSTPSPPAMLLVGKSPEYVSQFTTCYESKGKRIQKDNACLGWLIGYILGGAIWAATSSSSSE